MRRAPVVLSGTAVVVAGVLAYRPSTPSLPRLPLATAQPAQRARPASRGRAHHPARRTRTPGARRGIHPGARATPAGLRTVVGQDVPYPYGDLQVSVTAAGRHVTAVTVSRLDSTSSHSQSIDAIALPRLRAEALSAQSARIDAVSGASYTSQAYAESLQSALDKLT